LGLPPIVPQVIARRQPEDDQPAEEKVPRGSNPRAINLGWRFIGFGDARFSEQEYAEAYVRYKKAAQAAPVLADAYFRQGYALIALGRYELAATALKRGLEIDPGWAGSDFRNDDLYADHPQAKMAHLDALAQAAVEQPNDADLLFLVGVFLHFDGQTDRAKPFFRRAARIAGVGGDIHLRGFLEGGQ
jgi:tetratricopeptide (TPR) repeat protein